jgi:Fumarylacetoacetate (FAA) hydrolase family
MVSGIMHPADGPYPAGCAQLATCVISKLMQGYVMGSGNVMGEPISTADAEEHVFGVVLLNDWSARDIQKWEYQPLGPFNSKNWVRDARRSGSHQTHFHLKI